MSLKYYRCRLSSSIAFGLYSGIILCNSLHFPTDRPYTKYLTRQLQCTRSPRTLHTMKINLKSGFGNGVEGEGRRDDSLLRAPQERRGWNHYVSLLQISLTGFCAGALVVILLSMVMFSSSLSSTNNQQYSPYAGRNRLQLTSSIVKFGNRMAKRDTDEKVSLHKRSVLLYSSIMEQLDQKYVDYIEPSALVETSIRAMLSSLDPYTEYISPQDISKRQQLVGIGAFVMKAGDSPDYLDGKAVSTLMSNIPSPVDLPTHLIRSTESQINGYHVVLSLEGFAYDGGLRVGDVVLGIDNQSIVGDGTSVPTLETVRDLLKGPDGSKVKITFRRPGDNNPQSVELERKRVKFPDVTYAGTLDSGIGYIRLQRFGNDAGYEMQQAIQKVQQQRAHGLILDLRDNSGGELFSAVQIASLFFPDRTFLGSSEGNGSMYPNETYHTGTLDLRQYGYSKSAYPTSVSESGGIHFIGKQVIDPDNTRIVVLTNERTASAAEFISGVFQDLDKAIIIGSDESTLGKGIGQRELGLPDGGALKLTYHEFHTPSGRCVQKQYQNGSMHKEGKVFYTTNGREINDRAGIEVDYLVEPKTSFLNSILSSSGAYFAFASEYNTRLNQALYYVDDESVVNDGVYGDFKSFVLKEEKRGNLDLLNYFDDQHLLETITQLSYETNHDSAQIQISLANIRRQIVQDLLSEFESCNEIIRFELEQNILARRLPQRELIRRSLRHDDLVKEAASIIDDPHRFRTLLRNNAKLT